MQRYRELKSSLLLLKEKAALNGIRVYFSFLLGACGAVDPQKLLQGN